MTSSDEQSRWKPDEPRATIGDFSSQPKWEERLTVSVGPANADLVGTDERVIQAALDYVARLGGGTVRLLPGLYLVRNSVFLPSRTRLAGSGPETVITKGPSVSVALCDDSDWYDQEITLEDASAFRMGDGVVLRANHAHSGWPIYLKRTLVARSGNRLKLDHGLRENLWLRGRPECVSLFPLLTSEHSADVFIEDLCLDGNGANNELLDGNFGGCIFLQECNRFTLRNVEARNYNGDGISFQICHDVHVENCRSHGHSGFGLHPGSGSQRPVIRGCRIERNETGLFWCWGVCDGLAEDNVVAANRSTGISLGHNDRGNLLRNNEIRANGEVGVLFRNDCQGRDFSPSRNRLIANRLIDNGGEEGVAVFFQGTSRDNLLEANDLQETRGAARRVGIRISEVVESLELRDNRIEGFATPISDLRWPRHHVEPA